MAALVAGMAQVELPEARILGQLGGADEVAAAVGLDLGEAEQPQPPPASVPPDPSLQRLEQRAHQRYSCDSLNIAAGGLPMPGEGGSAHRRAALAASFGLGLIGLVLIAFALAATRSWADRHFLPAFAFSRGFQIGIVQALRILLGLTGLAVLLVVRPRIARAVAAGRGAALLLATLSAAPPFTAAFAVSEGILHSRTWHASQERWGKEPLRRRDPLLGWTFVPGHDGRATGEGRAIGYAIDPLGRRVRSAGDRLDPPRPTIIFAGESILFGYGLPWQDTIQARVEALTGRQVANLSVNAYATDQSYIRLRRELPRFACPVAIVIPFVPMLFDRMLDRDRPYLDARLRWHA